QGRSKVWQTKSNTSLQRRRRSSRLSCRCSLTVALRLQRRLTSAVKKATSRRTLATTLRVRCRTKKRPASSKSPRFWLMPPLSAKVFRTALRLSAPLFTFTTTATKTIRKPSSSVRVLQLPTTKTWRPTPSSLLSAQLSWARKKERLASTPHQTARSFQSPSSLPTHTIPQRLRLHAALNRCFLLASPCLEKDSHEEVFPYLRLGPNCRRCFRYRCMLPSRRGRL